jgi:hypothetical protein
MKGYKLDKQCLVTFMLHPAMHTMHSTIALLHILDSASFYITEIEKYNYNPFLSLQICFKFSCSSIAVCLMVHTFYLQDEDLNMPLLSESGDDHSGQSNCFPANAVGESKKIQTNRSSSSPRIHASADSGRIYPSVTCATQGMHSCVKYLNYLLDLLKHHISSSFLEIQWN